MSSDVTGIGSLSPNDFQWRARVGLPQAPPPELARAMAIASDAYERLSATGQQIHFGFDQIVGGFAVELQDLNGNPLYRLSCSDALQIAGGESLN